MTQEEKNNYTVNKWGKCEKERIRKKNHKFRDKSIYLWLAFESYCFDGQA